MYHRNIKSAWDLVGSAQCSTEYIKALSQAAQNALDELLSLPGQGDDVRPGVALTQTLLHILDEQSRALSENLETMARNQITAAKLAA